MDQVESVIHRKRKRYLAQTMDAFERDVQPLLPESHPAIELFKGVVRQKFNALAVDAAEVASISGGFVSNGFVDDVRAHAIQQES